MYIYYIYILYTHQKKSKKIEKKKVLALDKYNTHALHNRGISFDKLGQYQKAVMDLSEVPLYYMLDYILYAYARCHCTRYCTIYCTIYMSA